MAVSLVPCPACKHQVSIDADFCPQCGHSPAAGMPQGPIPPADALIAKIITIAMVIFWIIMAMIIFSMMPDFDI